jgi:leader peptidase (prepilin peptidase)/N-methyltransferase
MNGGLPAVNAAITAVLATLGACAASFINVAALRRAKGMDYLTGRSHCPACGRAIGWYDLIPVMSWLMLAGRCRACKTRISPRYLIVELTGALVSALCFIRYGLNGMAAIAFGAAIILLAVALIDLSMKEIPDGLVIALIPFAAGAAWAQPEVSLLSRAAGILAVSLPMLALALAVNGAFGGGDIKLMAVCGFLLGWRNTALAFFLSVVTAGCFSLSLILRGKAPNGACIAFGPHLCLGTVAAMLYGNEILSCYLKLAGL